ncbi:MAG TPA: alpha/beta hydrolase [Dehalococcoidia bacterium]|jgi:pimeloyl-ACP methyl ester carboxylesterase|nr:alpha/beta hydrolase [Dehalococcoidia bacterium]
MPYAKSNGIEIWYELHNQGDQVPLVLTHGFAGPSRQWLPELVPLYEQRTLLTYDVRGHDRSSVPPDLDAYSMPAFAADLAGLLKSLGFERAHVGGISMGGMVTAQFAVDYPEMCESVLLCDTTCGSGVDTGPAGDWERRLEEGIGTLAHLVGKHGLEDTVLREWEWGKTNDPHFADSPYTLEGNLYRISLMTVEGYLGAAHAILTRPDLTARIPAITAPTLVMIGAWDNFLPCAVRDAQLIPDSRLVVRERCGHGSLWRAATFVEQIESFLEDAESGAPIAGERRV